MNPVLTHHPPWGGTSPSLERKGAGESSAPPVPGLETWRPSDVSSVAWGASLSTLLVLLFMLFSEPCRHWFVIPILLCGIVIGMDVVDWLRGRMDLCDPVGIIGVLGFHGFVLAPLLHVSLSFWLPYVVAPPEWREWLGKMGVVNAAGLIVYSAVSRVWKARRVSVPRRMWEVRKPGFILLVALLGTAILQVFVYRHFGGIEGYVELYEKEADMGKSSFTGWGWVFIISESFPRLAFLAFALVLWRRPRLNSWAVLAGGFTAFFLLLVLFGGLRGSRSNFVWSLFWAAAVIHLCLRPIPRKIVIPGIAGLLLFMLLYAAYKHGGTKEFQRAVAGHETKKGTTLTRVVLGDLARSDVQAFLLYRLSRPGSDYDLAWGRTYLGAAALLIPEAVWPGRPPTKIQEGTEILWGKNSVIYGKASNLYGLGGETLLNFGPIAVPLAFGIFGLVLRGVRGWIYRIHPRDGRIFLLPVAVSLCILGLVCDSDNLVFFLFQYGLSLALVLGCVCRSVRRPEGAWRLA